MGKDNMNKNIRNAVVGSGAAKKLGVMLMALTMLISYPGVSYFSYATEDGANAAAKEQSAQTESASDKKAEESNTGTGSSKAGSAKASSKGADEAENADSAGESRGELIEEGTADEGVIEVETEKVTENGVTKYTVDFYYGDKEYHMEGGTEMMLSELFKELGIDKEVADLEDIEFTNSKVLTFTKEGDDYRITSIKAFATTEELTLTFGDGEEASVKVTDDASGTLGTDLTWEIAGGVLENELNRLIGLGMQMGVITYSRDGIIFEADQDQLFNLFKAYVAALSQDASVLETLSTTQLWSLLKLSEGGVNEQQYLAALNQQISSLELPGTFTLYIKAVIGMEGSLTLDVDYATTDGENALNLDAAVGEAEAEMTVVVSMNGVNGNGALNAVMTDAGTTLACNVTVSDMAGNNMTASETAFIGNDGKIEANESLKYASSYFNVDMVGKLNADCAAMELVYDVDAVVTEGSITATVNADLTFDTTNGLYAGFEVVDFDGQKEALYLNANAQTDEYGAQANATLEAVVDNQPIQIFELNAVMSDTLTVHATLNSLRYNTRVQHSEGSSWYTVSFNDFLFGYQYDYFSESEYNANADSFVDGVYNVFTFDCSLNGENGALNAEITYDGQTIAIEGALSESAYTVTVSAEGFVLATAELQLVGSDLTTSLLMGNLTITLYDGTVITRTTKMDGSSVSWVFTVTSNGQSQQFELGIRNKSAGSQQNYELFLAFGSMEYVAGIVFEQSAEKIFAELYVEMVSGGSVTNFLDATVELAPITEAPAHVSGQALPQSYLEQILVSLLGQVSDTIKNNFGF